MSVSVDPRRWSIRAEWLAVVAILAGLALTACKYFDLGYLPPPFVYDTLDNFMDWYNTAYWANGRGAYDIWLTVYPPVSFVFLKIFSLKACYHGDPFFARDCDWLGRVALFGFYLANIGLVFKIFHLRDARTAVMRTFAMSLGLPMLFALDRGNLVIPCFTCFALGNGRLLRSARLRWVALALSVNFKPYLITAIFPLVARWRWRALEGVGCAVVIVYLLTWAALGEGSPVEVIGNILAFQAQGGNAVFGATFYATTYMSLVNYATLEIPIMAFVGSRVVEILETLPHMMIQIGQLGVLASLVAVAIRPHAASTTRLAALGVAMAISTVEVGGYAEVFLLFLVFLEPWRGPERIVALIAAYMLCVSVDFMVAPLAHQIQSSYLSGRTVGYDMGLSLGMFVRPGLILVIEYALVIRTLRDVLGAGRDRGPSRDSGDDREAHMPSAIAVSPLDPAR